MSIEPSIAATVARTDPDPTDWSLYQKCSQVCRAEMGQPCFSLSGKVVGGQTDGVRTPLTHPHVARKLRRRARTYQLTPKGLFVTDKPTPIQGETPA